MDKCHCLKKTKQTKKPLFFFIALYEHPNCSYPAHEGNANRLDEDLALLKAAKYPENSKYVSFKLHAAC